jgi:hypothetical protein
MVLDSDVRGRKQVCEFCTYLGMVDNTFVVTKYNI